MKWLALIRRDCRLVNADALAKAAQNLRSAMKRQTRKSGRKVPMLWDTSMDFEVTITPLAGTNPDTEIEEKIIVLPVSSLGMKVQHYPPQPPLAA